MSLRPRRRHRRPPEGQLVPALVRASPGLSPIVGLAAAVLYRVDTEEPHRRARRAARSCRVTTRSAPAAGSESRLPRAGARAPSRRGAVAEAPTCPGGFLSELDPGGTRRTSRSSAPYAATAGGDVLFHEGDDAGVVARPRRPRARKAANDDDGREVILAFPGPGKPLGELSAVDGKPRSGTIRAVDDVEALVIPGQRVPRVPRAPAAGRARAAALRRRAPAGGRPAAR